MGWNNDRYFTPSKPKEVKDGIKAKTKRGKSFGDTWWSKRWISVLDSFGWDNRLQRGRTYARKGQVIDMEIEKGEVSSHVQGSRRTPYKVIVRIDQILDEEWEKVSDAMAEQAIFAENVGHPVTSSLALAKSTQTHIHAFGIDYDSAGGNNANFAPFNWQG